MKKVYIGNAIQGAPSEFLEDILGLKLLIQQKGFLIMDYIGLDPNPNAESVYEHDERCVLECDIFIAICTVPSTGLGMEIAIANSIHKPTLICFAQDDKKRSRMVLGSQIRNKNMQLVEYKNLNDIVDVLVSM